MSDVWVVLEVAVLLVDYEAAHVGPELDGLLRGFEDQALHRSHSYVFYGNVSGMVKLGSFFPGERLAPDAKRALSVQGLIQGIKDGLVVDVDGVPEEGLSLLLLLLIIIILLEL